jgi:hypothetical protein
LVASNTFAIPKSPNLTIPGRIIESLRKDH